MSADLIRPGQIQPPSGSEELGSATVLDFWRWALGDLRMNNARGYLVEYFVAKAIGDDSPLRIEWGPYDAVAADGTRVEIKATGLLQSWATKRLSTPAWNFKSVAADRVWSAEIGDYVSVDPGDRVHVWIFALQTCREPSSYDPLDVRQWEFRVMAHRQLLASGQSSARLSFFDRLGIQPVPYAALQEAVREASVLNETLPVSVRSDA